MITNGAGDLLKADVEALVNTVNCVGFMGKGIALRFKKAFPENNLRYVDACSRGEVRPGSMFIVPMEGLWNPRFIINFPTKRHWRANSKLADIEAGLDALVAEVRTRGIKSIAIPALGCGNGGLNWADVRPRIERAMVELADVEVLLFPPTELRGA